MAKTDPPWMRYGLSDDIDLVHDPKVRYKKTATGYVLLFIVFGFHRFYLRQYSQGFTLIFLNLFFQYAFYFVPEIVGLDSPKILQVGAILPFIGAAIVVFGYELMHIRSNTDFTNNMIRQSATEI